MSGKNTPRSVKRLRMLFVKMIQEHQSGKTPLKPSVLLKVADRIGVLDGFFPKEILALDRIRGWSPRSLTAPEEVEYDPEVAELMNKLKLKREG